MGEQTDKGSAVFRIIWLVVYLLAFIAAPLAIWNNYTQTRDGATLLKMALPLGVFCLFLIGRLVFLHATRGMARIARKARSLHPIRKSRELMRPPSKSPIDSMILWLRSVRFQARMFYWM